MHRLVLIMPLGLGSGSCTAMEARVETASRLAYDAYHPVRAERVRYNKPIPVRDTDSAPGRYSLKPKILSSLQDMARPNGNLCNGRVIAFVEIKSGAMS